MALFRNPFFKSKNSETENSYNSGVQRLQKKDYNGAVQFFHKAALEGHISAKYNLFLLIGGGDVTPYDFDVAADYWYKAAAENHPQAKQTIHLLEAADRGGFGYDNLANLTVQQGSGQGLPSHLMICAARFTDVVCKQFGATADVIGYELNAASGSGWNVVLEFVKRTGLDSSFYGHVDELTPGTAADQVTDGLNQFSAALRQAGFSNEHALMARCSVVGYLVQKSPFGARSQPLRGLDTFFKI